MKNIDVVVGSGFGDEGKGLFTNYLCLQKENPLVIRFNGGQQAGHHVFKDNIDHVFSNFGSGTLNGATTYWSEFCTVDPVGLANEKKILKEKGITPKLFIDPKCPITTPYDKYANVNRDNRLRHGSVGVGFGTTLQREEDFYHLTAEDLFYTDVIIIKINQIRQYYSIDIEEEKEVIREFLEACLEIKEYIKDVNISNYTNLIFEGAQGLLLDQHYGFFPFVTRSNTGINNVVSLINKYCINIANINEYYITRAYLTRHGNGPMSTDELINDHIHDNPYEQNFDNSFQGKFRKSALDLNLMEYVFKKDYTKSFVNRNLVVTCLDLIKEYRYIKDGDVKRVDTEVEFIKEIESTLPCCNNVFVSRSPRSEEIEEF